MIFLNLILFLVVIGLLWWLVTLIPMPHPFPLIIRVLFIILAVLCVLSVLFKISILGVTVPRMF